MKYSNDWHTISAEEAQKRLNVNPFTGLDENEARKRRKKYGRNRIWHIARMEAGKYVLRTAGDLSTVILAVTAILAFLFEDSREAVSMCVILLTGALLRITTYIKAKRILEQNAEENIPNASVLRGGKLYIISSLDIVPGDVLILRPGDTVPCDGRVISDTDSTVSESGITENKGPIRKFNTVIHTTPGNSDIPCESRPNIAFAGSAVLSGELRIIATACGKNALVSMKQGGIEIPSGDSLPLIERLGGWCKISELIMLAFILVISVISMFASADIKLEQVFFGAVSMAAASMSEYLTTIGYIIIAIAAQSSASGVSRSGMGITSGKGRKAAVIKNCSKIEEIAAADKLILGNMSFFKSGEVSFNSFFANGEIHTRDEASASAADIADMVHYASQATGAYTAGSESLAVSGGSEALLSPRQRIVKNAAELLKNSTPVPKVFIIDKMSGDAAMAAGIDTAIVQPADNRPGSANKPYVAAASNIQNILRCCTTYNTSKGALPLTDEIRKKIFTEAARLEFVGAKVIAVASRPSPYLTLTKIATLHSDMCFIGFFSLSEAPARGAEAVIRKIKSAGMSVMLLSENPEHDLYYGHELGLFNKKTKIIPYQNYSAEYASEKSVIVTVPRSVNNPEISPEAVSSIRYRIISDAADKTTAFITNEPIDARSLSSAGCGIAVCRSHRKPIAQALKNQAQIIVYPDASEEHGGFTESISALTESRRAILSIENAARYLTASQLSRLSIILIGVIFGFTIPTSTAILTSGLIFDFAAVLVMAFEKPPENVLSLSCSPLPKYTGLAKISVIWGTLCGGLCTLVPFMAKWTSAAARMHAPTDKMYVSLLTAAVFLSQLAVSSQFMRREKLIKRGVRLNMAYVCYAGATILVTLLILFEKNCASLIGGTAVPLFAAPFSLIPAAVLFIAMEIHKSKHQL